jgi:AraC-like DNA-binding protein
MESNVLPTHGWSISRLAREFGLSRRTIRRE